MSKPPTRSLLIKLGLPAILIPGLILAAQLGWNWQKAIQPNIPYNQNQQIFPLTALVVDASDGDTLILQNEIRIRLLGINSPERGQPYFEEAKKFTINQAKDKKVQLEYEPGYQDDKFGRILAYVFIINDPNPPNFSKSPKSSLNELLLREGLAQTSFYKDRRKLKYQDEFLQAESEARQKHLGLYSQPLKSPNLPKLP